MNKEEINNMTFEQALAKLEDDVRKLDSGNISLDESLVLFDEGINLVKFCSEKLEKAEQKINVLKIDSTKVEETLTEEE